MMTTDTQGFLFRRYLFRIEREAVRTEVEAWPSRVSDDIRKQERYSNITPSETDAGFGIIVRYPRGFR